MLGLEGGGGSLPLIRQNLVHRTYRGRGTLGTGEFLNGNIWHNKSVPNYAAVFEGPWPFFLVSFLSLFGMRSSIVPNNDHPEASRE